MMKKLFLFSVAALAFCACSSDEVVSENSAANQQPKQISFTPLNKVNTRAAVHGTTFPDQDMYVAAYMAAPNASNYFEKTAFKKNYQGGTSSASVNIWGGDPARYWPLSPATINFLAVTGASVNANHFTFSATNYANSVAVAYTIGNGYSATTQSDIMYAVGQGTVTQSNNTLAFAGGGTGENIGMTFYHALALLNFQVKAYSTTEVNKIVVNSITVNGASYTGNLTVTNANYAATDGSAKTRPTITWAPSPAVAATVAGTSSCAFPYTVVNKDDYYPGNSVDPLTWWNIMIVPSDTKATVTNRGFRSFTINYTVKGNTGQADQTYNYTYYPSGNTSTDTNVDEGKIYTYKINFRLHEIRIEPSVTDWVATSPAINPIDVQ